MGVVTLRVVSFFSRLVVTSLLVMLGRFVVVFGGLPVVLRGLSMVIRSGMLLWHILVSLDRRCDPIHPGKGARGVASRWLSPSSKQFTINPVPS